MENTTKEQQNTADKKQLCFEIWAAKHPGCGMKICVDLFSWMT